MAVKAKNNNKRKIIKLKINASWKNLFLYGFLLLFSLFLFMGFTQPLEQLKTVPLSEVISKVKKGEVTQITILDNKLTVATKEEKVQAFKEPGANLYQIFQDAGVSKEALEKI